MKDNKLIAEFMGATIGDRHVSFPDIKIKEVGIVSNNRSVEDLHYNTSWDWLMPVVEKIKILVMEDDSDELYNSEEWDNITHTLVQIEIKSVYQAVVEFINEYNKTK